MIGVAVVYLNAVHRLRDKLYRDGTWYSDYVRIRCKAVKVSPAAP